MKTQIITSRTFTTILALLLVAFTATQTAAQRREQNNTRQNINKAMGEANKSVAKDRETHKEYTKPGNGNYDRNKKDGNSRNDNQNGDRAHNHKGNGNHNDKNDNWKNNRDNNFNRGNNHSNWHPSPDFRVHIDPPRFHERDYRWHRHNHLSYRTLPRKAVWMFIDGENYAFYRGRFYLPGPFGFYRVTPPVYLRNLPENCMRVLIDGESMWSLHGVLFIETPFGFKIIV